MASLIYLSTEKVQFDEDGLKELSEKSNKRNQEDDITGFMSYKDGVFIQYFEGEKDKVNALFGRISQDRRHNIKQVLRFDEDSKLFPSWGMKYYTSGQMGPIRFEDVLELLMSRLQGTLSEGQISKLVLSNIHRIARK